MTEDQREIRRKKRVLESAEKLGNINTTCRRFGIARSTFYLWRNRYRVLGEAGLARRMTGVNYSCRSALTILAGPEFLLLRSST